MISLVALQSSASFLCRIIGRNLFVAAVIHAGRYECLLQKTCPASDKVGSADSCEFSLSHDELGANQIHLTRIKIVNAAADLQLLLSNGLTQDR